MSNRIIIPTGSATAAELSVSGTLVGAFTPAPVIFQRRDFLIQTLSNNAGSLRVNVAGDVTASVLVGDALVLVDGWGYYGNVLNCEVTAVSFAGGITRIDTDKDYAAQARYDFFNMPKYTNYKVTVTATVEEYAHDQITQTYTLYPPISGNAVLYLNEVARTRLSGLYDPGDPPASNSVVANGSVKLGLSFTPFDDIREEQATISPAEDVWVVSAADARRMPDVSSTGLPLLWKYCVLDASGGVQTPAPFPLAPDGAVYLLDNAFVYDGLPIFAALLHYNDNTGGAYLVRESGGSSSLGNFSAHPNPHIAYVEGDVAGSVISAAGCGDSVECWTYDGVATVARFFSAVVTTGSKACIAWRNQLGGIGHFAFSSKVDFEQAMDYTAGQRVYLSPITAAGTDSTFYGSRPAMGFASISRPARRRITLRAEGIREAQMLALRDIGSALQAWIKLDEDAEATGAWNVCEVEAGSFTFQKFGQTYSASVTVNVEQWGMQL